MQDVIILKEHSNTVCPVHFMEIYEDFWRCKMLLGWEYKQKAGMPCVQRLLRDDSPLLGLVRGLRAKSRGATKSHLLPNAQLYTSRKENQTQISL